MSATIIYDGDCPFCSEYVRIIRLKRSVGEVQLINARSGGVAVAQARDQGFDLNQEMVLIYRGRLYGGPDCLHMLALLSTRAGVVNKTIALLFSRPTIARLAYPILRAGRNLTLSVLRRPKI
jgi:predicted DCC family thiol-disulfide oxidoreductase YuxK